MLIVSDFAIKNRCWISIADCEAKRRALLWLNICQNSFATTVFPPNSIRLKKIYVLQLKLISLSRIEFDIFPLRQYNSSSDLFLFFGALAYTLFDTNVIFCRLKQKPRFRVTFAMFFVIFSLVFLFSMDSGRVVLQLHRRKFFHIIQFYRRKIHGQWNQRKACTNLNYI